MINENEKDIIVKCAKKYNVSDLYLFGSSIEKDLDSNDIDLGVKGIRPELFFDFYTELFKALPKPVDLIDLSNKSLFASMIEKRGLKIYGRTG